MQMSLYTDLWYIRTKQQQQKQRHQQRKNWIFLSWYTQSIGAFEFCHTDKYRFLCPSILKNGRKLILHHLHTSRSLFARAFVPFLFSFSLFHWPNTPCDALSLYYHSSSMCCSLDVGRPYKSKIKENENVHWLLITRIWIFFFFVCLPSNLFCRQRQRHGSSVESG